MRRILQFLSRNSGKEQGTALIEFVLVTLFLLLPFVTSVAAFTVILNQYLEMANAVPIGAQLLSVSRGNIGSPCTQAITAIYNATPFLTESQFSFTYTFTNNGTSTSYSTSSSPATACDTAAEETNSPIFLQGESVQLYVTYHCTPPLGVFVLGWINSLPCNLSAEATEIVQ